VDLRLATDRLTLRSVRRDDARRIARLIDDWDVAKMLARVPHPYRLEDAESWLDGVFAPDTDEPYIFAIDAGVGLAGIVGFYEHEQGPEIGYWLAKPWWGNGIVSEAARAAVDWRFRATDCAQILSGAFEVNPASQRILDKLGFEEIGRLPIYCRARDKRMPHINYRLTRDRYDRLGGEKRDHERA
jgi:RimJ/RimL family protein N-acetyltransferase